MNNDAELQALKIVVIALIEAARDRAALRETVDMVVAAFQLEDASRADGQTMRPDVRAALQRYRDQLSADAPDRPPAP